MQSLHYDGSFPWTKAWISCSSCSRLSTYIFDSIIESYPNSIWGFMYYKIFLGEDAVYYKLLLQELIFKSIFLQDLNLRISCLKLLIQLQWYLSNQKSELAMIFIETYDWNKERIRIYQIEWHLHFSNLCSNDILARDSNY